MSDGELRGAMRGSAMQRTKVGGLRRNLESASSAGNTATPRFIHDLRKAATALE